MPTNNHRPPTGITTEYLANGIRNGMTDQPDLAAAARPIADRVTTLIRHRLPDITAADTGAVMLHIGACFADLLTFLTEEGHTTAGAVETAISAIAMAGMELYDSHGTQAGTDQPARDAAERIRAWRQQLDTDTRAELTRAGRPIPEPLYPPDEEVPCRYGCGTDLRTDNGTELPLLLADIDAVLDGLEAGR